MWQSVRLSVLSCGSVCRSCVTVIARLASTHTALVSQSLVGLCFAFPSINQSLVRVVIICLAFTHTALVSSPSLTVLRLPTYIHAGRRVAVSLVPPSRCGSGAAVQHECHCRPRPPPHFCPRRPCRLSRPTQFALQLSVIANHVCQRQNGRGDLHSSRRCADRQRHIHHRGAHSGAVAAEPPCSCLLLFQRARRAGHWMGGCPRHLHQPPLQVWSAWQQEMLRARYGDGLLERHF